MSTRRTVLCIALGASWLLLPWAGSFALAGKDKNDPISQKIERERRALEKLKGEIQEKQKHADEAERKRESTLQAIQDLDGRSLRSRQERDEISRKLKQKDREIEGINGQLVSLRSRIGERRSSILARLRVQYMEGRFGYLKALLAADSYGAFQRRFQYLSAVSKREYDLLEAYQGDMKHLEQVEHQRADARNEMLVYKQHTDRKLEEIQGYKQQKKLYLARITREKELYDRAVAELQKSAARVDTLLQELEEKRRAALVRPRKETAGIRPFKGILHWPADGDVVSFFGRQKHPTFETYVQKKGIEIRTAEGSAIRAVMPGTVVYADWLKGYGLVLILDHANGFFSLYAHASKLLTKVGDPVQAGQVIGETGDTGMTGESTLYFELREGAEPVDPLAWLAKR
ncbi:MAG TPA: peptidoglycan DD-metalloendopeptidase family protein [Nitrospiraceae bacterium]|nr:peptidoglycan DD-metalloendopeptidase family protein [Nitrospiraceae bacterium]